MDPSRTVPSAPRPGTTPGATADFAHPRLAPPRPPLCEQRRGTRAGVDELTDRRDRSGEQVSGAEHHEQRRDDGEPGAVPARPGRQVLDVPAACARGSLQTVLALVRTNQPTQPGAPLAHQWQVVGVLGATGPPDPRPGTEQRRQVPEVPEPGGDDVARPAEPTQHHRAEQVHQRQERHHRHDAQQPRQLVVAQHRARLVAQLEPFLLLGHAAFAETGAVAHHDGRVQVDRGCCGVHTPAQVDVLTEVGDPVGEPADRLEEVRPDQQACIGHREDLARGVVLGLVELSGLRDREAEAVGVHRVADRLQDPRVVPLHEFRTDDATVGTEGLGHQRGHGAGSESDVVVEEQVERSPFDRGQHLVRRGGESPVDVEVLHERGGEHLGDAVGRIGGAAVVDDEHREASVVLRRQGLEGGIEPVPRVRRHHHGDDGRRAPPDQRLRVGRGRLLHLRIEERIPCPSGSGSALESGSGAAGGMAGSFVGGTSDRSPPPRATTATPAAAPVAAPAVRPALHSAAVDTVENRPDHHAGAA